MHTKDELRKQLIAQFAALSSDKIEQASRAVAEKAFRQFDWSKVETILAYKPLHGSGEIDPSYLLSMLSDKEIDFVAATKDAPFPTKHYDAIIVPVLGFDTGSYRLGRGGGWYDRLLASQKHATYIGLSYEFAHVEKLPHEPHDIPLHFIVRA